MKATPEINLYIGDSLSVLKKIPAEIVDCVVTSPPYWKTRDYGHPQQIGQEESHTEYIEKLVKVFNEIKRILKPRGTVFLNVGYKYQEKELLLIPEMLAIELQKNGWALINKIIWFKQNAMPSPAETRLTNVYEPVFLFVKKENKYDYYFNLDAIRIKDETEKVAKGKNIVGYEVYNSLRKSEKLKGKIIKTIETNGNLFAEVEWENGEKTIELVQDFNSESQNPVFLVCPKCGEKFDSVDKIQSIFHCGEFLRPVLKEFPEIDFKNARVCETPASNKRKYNGKFNLSPQNRGASPGARYALKGEYLTVQRRHEIIQPVICEYLDFWRETQGITIKEIDEALGYRGTAGHWFRKDKGEWGRGGSVPMPEDWFKLKKILKFDDIYDKWVTETHLVLQTVRTHPKGRNPGDVWVVQLEHSRIEHFAIFPEELVKYCILLGCPDNGTVLDPFAGSGTTGKVAALLNRNAILIELVEEYAKIIQHRCEGLNLKIVK